MLLILIILAFAVKTSAFQTWLAQRLARHYSNEWDVEVSIASVDIKFFKTMELEDIFIEDEKGDTLLFAPELNIEIGDYSLSKSFLSVRTLQLVDPRIKIAQYAGSNELNYAFLVEYFASEEEDTTAGGWDFQIENLIVENGNISYQDFNASPKANGFDENNINVFLDAHVSDFHEDEEGSKLKIESLRLKDQSGFRIRSLTSELALLEGGIRLDDFNLKTNHSVLSAGKLQMIGDSWDAFANFVEEVKLSGSFREGSQIHLADFAYFSDDLNGAKHVLDLKGDIRGYVNRLKLRNMFVQFAENSWISGDFDFDGLPNIDETFLYLSIDELRSSKHDLEQIELPPFDGSNFIELPENLGLLGDITIHGNLTGFTTDFVAYADLNSEVGDLSSDIEFRVDPETENFNYRGRLISHNFDVGALYGISEIGVVSADIRIDTAFGLDLESLYASVHGNISKLQVHGYDYSNINVEQGTFEKDYFVGNIHVRDPNLFLDYAGKVDFSSNIPKYDFDVSVNDAFLDELNLLDDPKNVVMCFNLHVDSASGNSLDNLKGDIRLSNVNYHDLDKDFSLMEDIYLKARQSEYERSIIFESEMLNASIVGDFTFAHLSTSFQYMAYNIFPSLIDFDDYAYLSESNDQFDFKIDVFDVSPIALIFDLDLSVEPQTIVTGAYNSLYDEILVEMSSEKIIYGDQFIDDLSFNTFKEMDIVIVQLKADNVVLSDGLAYKNVALTAVPFSDNLDIKLSWDDGYDSYGRFHGLGTVYGTDEFEFTFDSSAFSMISKEWMVDKGSMVRYDSSNVSVNQLHLWTVDGSARDSSKAAQELLINGQISSDPNDELGVRIRNFKLENLTPLLGLGSDSLFGTTNGEASISGIYDVPILVSDLRVDSLKYNKSFVGNVDFSSRWNTDNAYMGLMGNLDRGEFKSFGFDGKYYVYKDHDNLDFTVTFDETDLGVIDEFLPSEDISEFHAYASGNVHITGKPSNPILNGRLSVLDGQIKINYLNTKYFFGGDILIEPNMMSIESMPLSDEETHLLDLFPNGSLSGSLTHNNFDPESMNYNFNLDFQRLMLMNTSYEQNPLFYGVVFGSGKVNVRNRDNLIEINVEESVAEKGTRFNLPLYGVDDVVLQNFISFVDDEKKVEDFEVDLENIRLNMSLDVTEEAEILILFDPAIGDIMSGSAQGHLDIEISELGEFLMYGDLEVVRGDYLFTMYNVINKRFEVEPGGTIKWLSGSPYDAIVDLNTIYRTKAPLYNLVLMEDEKYQRKTGVECYMNLKNDLYNPELAFDIKIPKGDQAAEAALNKLRVDNEEMTKQFFSLLVINNFVSSQSSGYGSYALNATTADLLNNQLSNWLSQLSDDVDLGFHYTPGDNLTQRELALAFETQLLNERLLISGNFGGARGTTVTNNEIKLIGDFTVEYKVNEDGTFRIKGFNETNDDDLTNTSNGRYTQGVGVFYTEDFDKVGELKWVQTIRNWFKKDTTTDDSDNLKASDSGTGSNERIQPSKNKGAPNQDSIISNRYIFKEED